MTIKSQRDFWSGLIFVAIGAAFAIGGTNYDFGSSIRPGPGYFSVGMGILLAILGVVVLIKSLTVHTADGEPVARTPWKPLVLILLAVVAFGALLPILGMVLTLPLLIFIGSLASGEFKIQEVLITIVVLTLGCWAIFSKGLNLLIPLWPTFLTA